VPAPALFTNRKELLSGELAAGLGQRQKDAPLETKSVLMFSQGGKLVDRYDKAVLLPFVEYTPLKRIMPFLSRYCVLERDIVRGSEGSLLSFRAREWRQPVKMAPAICEEEMRAGLIRLRRLAGADFVVSVSEEGWFQNGWHQYDRLGSAVLRAVETRTSVARAASLGVSCIITPLGRIVAAVDGDAEDRTKSLLKELGVVSPAPGGRLRPTTEFLWNKKPEAAKAGVLAVPVLIADEKSYYLQNGDLFAVCCLCLSIGMIVAGLASFRGKSPV